MKNKLLIFLSLISSTLVLSLNRNSIPQNIPLANQKSIKKEKLSKDTQVIISYKDVLKTYYNLATINTKTPSISFNDFENKFYSENSDYDLYNQTLQLSKENNNYDYTYSKLSKSTIRKASGFSSRDEDYILNNTHEQDITPNAYFEYLPSYMLYNYSSVLQGDIVYETQTILFNAGHNAIISNPQHECESGKNYIQTIEAVESGVKYGYLDDYRMVKFKCKILRVKNANDEQKNNAVYFASNQVGKTYNLNIFRLNTSINSTEWYCSELVYACFKYAGIDIGVKKDGAGNDVYLQLGCLPSDIYNSYNTSELTAKAHYLYFTLKEKKSTTWIVNIRNTSEIQQKVAYNRKMCFSNDAKTWSNLNDISTFTLSPYSSRDVNVSENFFATSIVAALITEHGSKAITYADNLKKSNNNYSLKQYNTFVKGA